MYKSKVCMVCIKAQGQHFILVTRLRTPYSQQQPPQDTLLASLPHVQKNNTRDPSDKPARMGSAFRDDVALLASSDHDLQRWITPFWFKYLVVLFMR